MIRVRSSCDGQLMELRSWRNDVLRSARDCRRWAANADALGLEPDSDVLYDAMRRFVRFARGFNRAIVQRLSERRQ